MGSFSLLQGLFPSQGSNPGFPHCGQILYQLEPPGKPKNTWMGTYPFSSRSSWPRNETGVSCIAGGFTANWSIQFQFSRSVVSDTLRSHESQHARPPCPSPTPGVYSNSCPLSRWCHPAISSSVIPFSSCPQSLPASVSFPMSQSKLLVSSKC